MDLTAKKQIYTISLTTDRHYGMETLGNIPNFYSPVSSFKFNDNLIANWYRPVVWHAYGFPLGLPSSLASLFSLALYHRD